MDPFSIVLTVLMVAILGTLIVLFRDLRGGIQAVEPVQVPVEARMTALELQFASLKGTVEEELERARKAWSRARARESYLRRKEELEDFEEEPDEGQDFRSGHAPGGPEQGMLPLPDGMGVPGQEEPFHVQAARAYARSVIGA